MRIDKLITDSGQRVAMNVNGRMSYLLRDHLGSVVAVTDSSRTLVSEPRYMPFGGARLSAESPTDFGYTGQRSLAGTGLMWRTGLWR